MRILLASDKFKGSLRADDVATELSAGLYSADPSLTITSVPVADGGDGTLDAAIAAGFEPVDAAAAGPTGQPLSATYGRRGDTALIELAGICGLARLGADLDPMGATSYGLGLALAATIDAGVTRIVLGIGGSASTDGGAGLLVALGAGLFDSDGRQLAFGGGGLGRLARLDLSRAGARLSGIELVVASDVDNPLCGVNGAAAIYGPQKGADAEQVRELDANLGRLAELVRAQTGIDHASTPGAGAAGGVGFGALVLGGRLRPGIELMMDLVNFATALDGVDLVITGEGSLDEQTLAGKAPIGVAGAARARGIPVIAVAGRVQLSAEQLHAAGIERTYALRDLEPDLDRSLAQARPLLRRIGAQIGADLLAGGMNGAASAGNR